MNKIKILDGVRGLSILMVLFSHLTILSPNNWFSKLLLSFSYLGRFGVNLFFILSGFLITLVLLKTKQSKSYFKNFYIRRILRILPVYYLFLFLGYFIFPYFANEYNQANSLNAIKKDYIWYMTFLSNILYTIKNQTSNISSFDITWSLCIEEHFYLIYPIIVKGLKLSTLKRFCISIIIGSFLLRSFLLNIGFSPLQIIMLTPCQIDSIALGSIVGIYYYENKLNSVNGIFNLSCFILSTSLIMLLIKFNLLKRDSIVMNSFGYSLINFSLTTFLIMLLLLREDGFLQKIMTSKLLTRNGQYSFFIYLFHYPISTLIRELLNYNKDSQILIIDQVYFYTLNYLILIFLGYLSYNYFELFFLKYKNKFK